MAFRPLLLSPQLYLCHTEAAARDEITHATIALKLLATSIIELTDDLTPDLLSLERQQLSPQLAIRLQQVALAYFATEKVAYLLSASEWEDVQAKFSSKYKIEIGREVINAIESKFLNFPFVSISLVRSYLAQILPDFAQRTALTQLLIEIGSQPEAELYVPVNKSDSTEWDFMRNNAGQIESLPLKDHNSASQYLDGDVFAVDGWLLLKPKK